ncbi:MAG: hypothetical protein ACK44W_17300, partial [Planctomycetota bacterium]
MVWGVALSAILYPSVLMRVDLAQAVADHDHHPGLGHPAPGEGGHTHGDPDDHHENPNSPCHHHDIHTCCGTPITVAPAPPPDHPGELSSLRIRLPQVYSA